MWSGYRRPSSRPPWRAGGVALALVFAAQACAGRSTSIEPSADDDSDHAGRSASGGKGGSGAGRGGSAGHAAGKGAAAGTDESDVPYNDPGCPDAAAPNPILECNVFAVPSGCPDGTACKPQIEHPYGSGCDQQVFNMRCVYPGIGEQGAGCENGMSDCAEGYLCVIGAAHGAHCLQMCPLDGSTRCPAGYVCGATDADGIGVCG
jgi:hypothetical protein